jgi:hypothetical protein
VSKNIHVITRIDGKGIPVSPIKSSGGYNISIGVIVWENVPITCTNLRAKQYKNPTGLLMQILFNCYEFGKDERDKELKKIKEKAMRMMVKELSTCRNMANKLKDEDFEIVIQKKSPQITEEQWMQFIESHKCTDFNKKSAWGKAMRIKIMMDHNLGTYGYIRKKKVWALQDAAEAKVGRPAPLSYIDDGRTKDFVRGRSQYDKVKGETHFKSKEAKDVHDSLLSCQV